MKTFYTCTDRAPETDVLYSESLTEAVDTWLVGWGCWGYADAAELYDDLTKRCPCSVVVCEVDDERLNATKQAFKAVASNAASVFNVLMGLPPDVELAARWGACTVDAWLERIGGLRTVAVRSDVKRYTADELFLIMLRHYGLPDPDDTP